MPRSSAPRQPVRRATLALVATVALAAGGLAATSPAAASTVVDLVTCDLNGDGRGDAPIGIPGEDIGAAVDTGAVQVLFGSSSGLTAAGDLVISQSSPGMPGKSESGDDFGVKTVCGDFDGDGYDELVISASFEDIGTRANAGAVTIVPGSSGGPVLGDAVTWHQGTPGIAGALEADDRFGHALAVGDFDGDGFDDLAVGSVGEDLGPDENAGMVHVFYGSSSGLSRSGETTITQSSPGVAGTPEDFDFFGSEMIAADMNVDGADELILGTPHEDIGSREDAGSVSILYGSPSGVSGIGSLTFHQNTPGVAGGSETGDQFGESLAAYRAYADIEQPYLAVGVPYEDLQGVSNVGAVQFFSAASGALDVTVDRMLKPEWDGDGPQSKVILEPDMFFGLSMATVDVEGDGLDEIIIGVPGVSVTDDQFVYPFAGGVVLQANPFEGGGSGFYDHTQLLPYPEAGALFGLTVMANDFDGNGRGDIMAGAPFFDFGPGEFVGLVTVVPGSATGFLDAGASTRWHQDRPGVAGTAEAGDGFGFVGGNP